MFSSSERFLLSCWSWGRRIIFNIFSAKLLLLIVEESFKTLADIWRYSSSWGVSSSFVRVIGALSFLSISTWTDILSFLVMEIGIVGLEDEIDIAWGEARMAFSSSSSSLPIGLLDGYAARALAEVEGHLRDTRDFFAIVVLAWGPLPQRHPSSSP